MAPRRGKLIVLDRDGVINEDSDRYIKSPAEWHALPGSLAAIADLNRGGFDVVVATNQSGVGRGLFSEDTLEAIHARMRSAVGEAGGEIAAIYVCPHRPDAGCDCRKPLPGLLQRIAADFARPLHGVPVVGDKISDVDAAEAAGARPIFVRTGRREEDYRHVTARGIEVFSDLRSAAAALLAE